jgi:hypothetical protein
MDESRRILQETIAYLVPQETCCFLNYLKKMGLTKKRMLECDALFVYQLLLPIVDPAM